MQGSSLWWRKSNGLAAPLLVAHRVMGATLCFPESLEPPVDTWIKRSPFTTGGTQTAGGQIWSRYWCRRAGLSVIVLCRLGYPESALRDVDRALRLARELGQAGTLLYTLMFASMIELSCSRFANGEARVEELLTLSEKYGLSFWKLVANCCAVGSSPRQTGATKRSNLIASGLLGWPFRGQRYLRPFSLAWLARAHASCGRIAEAQNAISQALELP